MFPQCNFRQEFPEILRQILTVYAISNWVRFGFPKQYKMVYSLACLAKKALIGVMELTKLFHKYDSLHRIMLTLPDTRCSPENRIHVWDLISLCLLICLQLQNLVLSLQYLPLKSAHLIMFWGNLTEKKKLYYNPVWHSTRWINSLKRTNS